MNRIYFLARKEFIQLARDWRTLTLALVLPVFVLLLFGVAISLDVKDVKMAVVDRDGSRTSRDLTLEFSGSGYFKTAPVGMDEAKLMLEDGSAMVALIIPPHFERDVARGSSPAVQILVDGSNANTGNIALGYANGIMAGYAFDLAVQPIQAAGLMPEAGMPPIKLEPRARFNPALSSTTFFVPGLVALIMMITVVVLSALSIVKEKELGTLETLMVSPLARYQFILGKLAPYFVLGYADLFLILGAGRIFFGMPFRGSLVTLTVLSGFFILGGLGLGLFISTAANTQQTAWMISLLVTLLPSIILSGFVFPIRIMPVWLRAVTYLFPVRYYLTIVRGIALKGSGVADLKIEILALLAIGSLFLVSSIIRFHKRVV